MKPAHRACPDDDLLVAWHDGEATALLDAGHAEALAGHIADCARCQARLAGFDDLEADLGLLRPAPAAPDPAFTRRVLAALPPPASLAGVAPGRELAAWWRRQAAALTLVVAGLLVMLATNDAVALLGNAWQQANIWANTATTSDAAAVGALWSAGQGGAATPEAYIGLVIGAILLVLGTGVFMVRTLTTPLAPAALPLPVRQL